MVDTHHYLGISCANPLLNETLTSLILITHLGLSKSSSGSLPDVQVLGGLDIPAKGLFQDHAYPF